jgi:hypothetical protein
MVGDPRPIPPVPCKDVPCVIHSSFKAARRASTPLIAVTTQEPASTMRRLEGLDPTAPSLRLDLMAGLRALIVHGNRGDSHGLDGYPCALGLVCSVFMAATRSLVPEPHRETAWTACVKATSRGCTRSRLST